MKRVVGGWRDEVVVWVKTRMGGEWELNKGLGQTE